MSVGKLQGHLLSVGRLQVAAAVGNLTGCYFLVGNLTPSRLKDGDKKIRINAKLKSTVRGEPLVRKRVALLCSKGGCKKAFFAMSVQNPVRTSHPSLAITF